MQASWQLRFWDELGTAVLKFRMPLEDLVDLGLYSTACLETIVRVYIRGTEEFVGLVVVCDDDDRGSGASTLDDVVVDVKIEAWADWHWFMSGRTVYGTGGAKVVETSVKPNVGLDNLVESQCDDSGGNLIEPSEYATLDGGGAVERDVFGSFAFGSASSGTHPDTITRMMWDTGEGLYESVLEALRRYDLKIVSSWNKTSSPPKCTATVTYPRNGTDRTTTLAFDRETNTLARFSRKVDRGKESNVAQVQGQGRETSQTRGYAINEDSYSTNGLRETGDLWATATQNDADEEAEFVIAQVGGSHTTYKARIREISGQEYGTHFFLGDKVTVSCSRRNVTVEDYITWVKWTLSGSGPLNLEIGLGREEPTEEQKSQRGGGGGRGGRRSGGKSKKKTGDSETDPDDIDAFKNVTGDIGTATADSHDDTLSIVKESSPQSANQVLAPTVATDGPEKVQVTVRADPIMEDITPDHVYYIEDSAGQLWKCPCVSAGSP